MFWPLRGRAGKSVTRAPFLAAAVLFLQYAQADAATSGPHDSRTLGVATCASTLCHGSARPLTARTVQQNEYVTWSTFDPHARAYRVLREEQGTQIAKRLGLKNGYEAPQCLACHADTTRPTQRGEKFQLSDGIGCETCHGPSEHWLQSHDDTPAITHAANVANGMRPLEHPETRAELCIACHVGDPTRFATHQMMAAGHPRLAFELDTYTELWRTSGGREHFRRDDDYLARKGRFDPVQTWLAGLTAITRREADLVEQRLTLANGGFPDFALFNCYSCHRSMRVAAWERKDDETTPPGTLRLHDGHARTLLAVLDATDESLSPPLRNAVTTLQSANGNPTTIHAASQALTEALQRIDRHTARRAWTKRDKEAALDALVAAARRGSFVDYAAAEQAAMGMVLLLAELDVSGARAGEVDDMFRTLQDDAQFDGERFARALGLLTSTQ
jgi:cytochrome c554/c'-like protein